MKTDDIELIKKIYNIIDRQRQQEIEEPTKGEANERADNKY
jgi:hypothetical protein